MRAALRRAYGGPEAVEFDDVPEPVPAAGEIVVRVHATTVNRTDCAYRSGKPWINRLVCGWPRPKVQVLGSEFAGVVYGVGDGVADYAVGDRVFGFVDGRPGAHAELVAVRSQGLVAKVPAGWSFADAAPGMEGAHYAQACLRVAGLRAGDRVLVHGASGGIGSALVQLLHADGVAVTAACDQLPPTLTEQLAHAEGVAWVPSHAQGALPREEYDAVIDATGHFPFGEARRFLRPEGIYISSDLGRGGQNVLLAAVGPVVRRLGRRHARFPLPHADAEIAAHLADLMGRGLYRPVVDRVFDFDDLRAAYAYVNSGRKVGNVVVTMPAADHG